MPDLRKLAVGNWRHRDDHRPRCVDFPH